MLSSSNYNTKGALNLSNSIIGVSILAMPYCMKSCGIVLGVLLLIGSALLTRFTCHLLLKSAVVSRRKSFEFIAFHTFGSTGKLFAELNIIGFMLGLLISFFVVFGDLGAAIISEVFGLENSDMLRTVSLVILGFGIAFPLAMLKEIDAISKISTLSVIFYVILGIKIILEALPTLVTGHWKTQVILWEPRGVLQCLPIFALALSCQTQIFTVCESLPDPSLKTMNSIVKLAVYLCSGLYMIVGLFGYIGGCEKEISGNVLVSLSPGFSTEIIKLGFVLSVAMSFPLVILPCRSSIYSLLFKKLTGPFDIGGGLMPELKFKSITFVIVFSTFIIGLLCPNIEIVLGFVGSTIGVLICIIFPAMMFIKLTPKNTFEKRGSQVVLTVGVILLVSCTWIRLQSVNSPSPLEEMLDTHKEILPNLTLEKNVENQVILKDVNADQLAQSEKPAKEPQELKIKPDSENVQVKPLGVDPEIKRQEPPIPESPDIKQDAVKVQDSEINVEAIRKEDKELNNANKETEVLNQLENDEKKAVLEQVEIIKKLEAHQEVEKKLLEERRQLLAEIINHKKVHESAAESNNEDDIKETENKINLEGNKNKREGQRLAVEHQVKDKVKNEINNNGSQNIIEKVTQDKAHNNLNNIANQKSTGKNIKQDRSENSETKIIPSSETKINSNSQKQHNSSIAAINKPNQGLSGDTRDVFSDGIRKTTAFHKSSVKSPVGDEVLAGKQKELKKVEVVLT